jgi:hypothetical protein
MTAFDMFYLGLVLVAVTGFAVTLAYCSHRDRLPKKRLAETTPIQTATDSSARVQKVPEYV